LQRINPFDNGLLVDYLLGHFLFRQTMIVTVCRQNVQHIQGMYRKVHKRQSICIQSIVCMWELSETGTKVFDVAFAIKGRNLHCGRFTAALQQ
jgi:hypothetical protein